MTQPSAVRIAQVAARAADSKKADNVQVLKMPEVMVEAEFFVICSAQTQVQVRVVVDAVNGACTRRASSCCVRKAAREQLDPPGLRCSDCPCLLGRGPSLLRFGKAVG